METMYHPNMPFAPLYQMGIEGIEALYHEKVPGLGFSAYLEALMYGAGVNNIIQVNDCETSADWTESDDGEFDVGTQGATGNRVGTNCLLLEANGTTAVTGVEYVDTIYINQSFKIGQDAAGRRQMDWRDTRYLGFWIHNETSSHFNTAGELKVAIVNNGTKQTEVSIEAMLGAVHQYMEIDMEANSWTRDRVESLRFYCSNTANEDIYIDDIIRYQLSYDRGPFYGCMFPVKSATVLSNGDTVAWSIDGLVKEAAAAADTLGPVRLYKNGAPVSSGTGTARRDLMGVIPGYCIFIGRAGSAGITAGDAVEWESNGYYIDVTGAATENGFAFALETAGAQYDDVFLCAKVFGASD